ncbi:helix-turn-helix domain-containing protein [Nonomuraea candida]|uniref:helix-turn-helix domain-containing protein n=1 Tax=Nonomuraea candida TaxID=359159 RepID=UPI000A01DF46|nr:AraC family transcriptional regulator [Nonomuraea candida]
MCHPAWGRALTAARRLNDFTQLRRVRDRIDREYARPLDLEPLARDLNLSPEQLSHKFHLAFGQSPYDYVMTRRVDRAMLLLRRGDLSVPEVCATVGCTSLNAFSTRFTERAGIPPTAYQRRTATTMPTGTAPRKPIRRQEAPAPEPRPAQRSEPSAKSS